jgi:hypothetical protein
MEEGEIDALTRGDNASGAQASESARGSITFEVAAISTLIYTVLYTVYITHYA